MLKKDTSCYGGEVAGVQGFSGSRVQGFRVFRSLGV